MSRFLTIRKNGKSNSDILCELVGKTSPGDTLSYKTLGNNLETGTNKEFDKRTIQNAVAQGRSRILRETNRALINVRNTGYRVAYATEHGMVASKHESRGQRQIRMGLMTLENVNMNEMTVEQRQLHEGQLMIISGMYSDMKSYGKRLSRVEEVLREVLGKDKL